MCSVGICSIDANCRTKKAMNTKLVKNQSLFIDLTNSTDFTFSSYFACSLCILAVQCSQVSTGFLPLPFFVIQLSNRTAHLPLCIAYIINPLAMSLIFFSLGLFVFTQPTGFSYVDDIVPRMNIYARNNKYDIEIGILAKSKNYEDQPFQLCFSINSKIGVVKMR